MFRLIIKKMNLLLLFLNGLLLIDKVLTVNEPKVGKNRPTFDEIYGKGWDEDDHQKIKVETSPLNSGENALNEQADHDDNIDQDVDAYNSDSTDQNLTQENPDRIDQINDETIEGINEENELSEKEKREIVFNFHAIKEKYKKKGKVTKKEWAKIEEKIGKSLGVYREKIYKWKKEFGLIRKTKRNKNDFYEKKKREFIKRMDEIKKCQPGKHNKLAKDLGISEKTFVQWKKEFGLPVNSNIIYSKSEKLELIGKYYEIKQRNPKLNVTDIAKRLNVARAALYKWKKQFDSILNKNSVDEEHSLAENRITLSNNDTSEHSMPSSDDNLWAWNLAKKKRTERTEVENTQ